MSALRFQIARPTLFARHYEVNNTATVVVTARLQNILNKTATSPFLPTACINNLICSAFRALLVYRHTARDGAYLGVHHVN